MPDRDRIVARLQALWEIAGGPGGGADRPAYSAAEARAMRLVAGWAAQQDLEPGIDPHGNLWAVPRGWSGSIVTVGSHVDTVPDGGRYDGALGTVLGLEVARDLPVAGGGARTGLLVCAAEEAPRFGAGTIGSRLLAGALAEPDLARLSDARGTTAAQAREGYLRALEGLPRTAAPAGRLQAHAEIHVAQRRALRRLGVVTRVAAPNRYEVTVTGAAGHSGEVSMETRRDALAGAAELILAVEAAARAEPPETVATVGAVAVEPGAVSVIPAQARLSVDVRGVAAGSLARVEAALRARAEEVMRRRELGVAVATTRTGAPVAMDGRLAAAALDAARDLGVAAEETWSGAGHDAQHIAGLAPALLLFVPLHGGESHTPQEGADLTEICHAAGVAARALGAWTP